jgi:glutaredoxin
MRMRLLLSSVILPAVLATAAAQAQPYRWVDEKGRVQFSDTPPPKAKEAVRAAPKPASIAPAAPAVPAAAPEQLPFEIQRAQKDFPVTLYTSPGCKEPCELARAALNRRGVPFAEVQVWNNETVELLKARSGGDSVPTLAVGRTTSRGFEQGQYDALLDSAGYPPAGSVPARAQKPPPLPEGYEVPPATPPVAEPVPPAEEAKRGRYDPSGLKSNRPEGPGRYALPDAGK